jgi:hypothetical protein
MCGGEGVVKYLCVFNYVCVEGGGGKERWWWGGGAVMSVAVAVQAKGEVSGGNQ